MQSLIAFFTKRWSPSTTQAEQLGYAYTYDEQGSLIAQVGSGGTNSAGQAQYIYLPTANGPMPIAAVIDGATYAVHSDHLNTPRKLTNSDGQAVWQWSYSAFGEDKPTIAKNRFANLETTPNPGTANISEVKFNLRYPGQYADEESGLFYNYFRSYNATTGRYSQPDPIGLDGGWNRFGYVDQNPLSFTDPLGLQTTVDAAIRNALGKGDIAELETLLEAANPSQAATIRSGIEKFGSRATDWIGKNCRGSINREFPGELREKTLKEIMDQSKSGDSVAKKAWKLLNDNRFKK
ncbi:RHS repeat-associated core domain-containing protein [Variovorax sp. OK605]|jgi:RHS repeat-associated protein|uniref:RHS repeat domain-containing protein n=1 Tax=Variovorax sp. OK605 TaxID=1855317 RepID=UPI0008F2963F|nr:RHS repeat-associated core domain-containing protein [Variovorax sp. OK605]SFP64516.1 RHS repeat-associated core domain-containing protein [Variovorax sp. OK605]